MFVELDLHISHKDAEHASHGAYWSHMTPWPWRRQAEHDIRILAAAVRIQVVGHLQTGGSAEDGVCHLVRQVLLVQLCCAPQHEVGNAKLQFPTS